MTHRVALVGARGHTGGELVRLIDQHPSLELVAAGSRALAGEPVSEHFPIASSLRFEEITPSTVGGRAEEWDVLILALPNGHAGTYVEALRGATLDGDGPVVIDLSADHRFDDDWYYGLPEITGARYAGQRLIANPGCYATAMALAVAPLVARTAGACACFGVSGYSGAGTTPSPRNDPEVLRDNLLPYALTNHVHEREVAHQLRTEIAFTPHVAAFFRGICLTTTAWLTEPFASPEAFAAHYAQAYADYPLVEIVDHAPAVRDVVGLPVARIGGHAVQGTRVTVVSVLDNLLKGAASQAIQNINLACGFAPQAGLEDATHG